MAFYDNRHWLLSHIRNSFVSGDDTGMSEVVMSGQNLCQRIPDQNKYPGIEEDDDDEDDLPNSLDDCLDLEFGVRRQRSNTALRLEKMDREKKEAANITRVKWKKPKPFSSISEVDKMEMFAERKIENESSERVSLLTQQLQKCIYLPQNPFREYAKYDGNVQIGMAVKKFGIYLTMLRPEHKNYPMYVSIISSAKISDLIGFILWKCSIEYPEHPLKEDVMYYGLHIVEDDGEIDSVFPCLDPTECVSKFIFKMLALVERSSDEVDCERKVPEKNERSIPLAPHQIIGDICDSVSQINEDLNSLHYQMSAIDALLYKSYKILLLNKVRSKIEVNIGISGEKIDIDPVLKQNSTKFFTKRKPTSYDIDLITACDLTETKSNNRAVFRLVYDSSPNIENGRNVSASEKSWSDFKYHDFESEQPLAEEIVQKINHILNLRCSTRRTEYLSMREQKSHRRRSFHLGPR